ncbi:MAG: class I SAM-dependent methyltransferase [Crocinitomicaceae bacterium]|nr:class I SAM-dependent methyltransferase [Crocinitomicaceae bacterium]MDG1776474.1 class I SAM-dependent methyltransferase [Crocinitomicaceae bacterium]
MEKEWFASWFDTPYYHILYKNRDDAEAKKFILNLIDNLKLPKTDKVLDLACGKGRHSVTLNESGYDVLGVDLSPASIASANKYNNARLRFDVHDMREVLPNESFSAIFNLFTSFGYFNSTEDNKKVLNSIHTMLSNNGVLIIDFMNASRVIEQLIETEVKRVDEIVFNISRRYDGSHIYKDIKFEDNGKSFSYTERVQALKKEDFEHLLEACNFEILRTFGDFNLSEFNEKDSDRLIIIAQKK